MAAEFRWIPAPGASAFKVLALPQVPPPEVGPGQGQRVGARYLLALPVCIREQSRVMQMMRNPCQSQLRGRALSSLPP